MLTESNVRSTMASLAAADALIGERRWQEAIVLLEERVATLRPVTGADGAPCERTLHFRLATLYRSYKRFEDELSLLENYLDAHPEESQRSRFLSRLSKVRVLVSSARTSSVVPVRSSVLRAPTRARPTQIQGTNRHAQEAMLQSAASTRARAKGLVDRAAAALVRTSQVTSNADRLLQELFESRTQLRALMAELGAHLKRTGVEREKVMPFVGEMFRLEQDTPSVVFDEQAADAARWCLEAFDLAA